MNAPPSERGLLDIRTFLVPKQVVDFTIDFLQRVGREGYEGFVVWGGQVLPDGSLRFTSALVPEQRAMMTKRGLLVLVEGEALFRVNKVLFERGEILSGQVHSHPTTAYHSSTDDHYPLVTLLGSLSLVVPDFALNAPADVDSWAWYRLGKRNRWEKLKNSTRVIIE